MPDTNEWLFDIIWDLSDRAQEADLPALAIKLEEAMDTYLAETMNSQPQSMDFKSQRCAEANERINAMRRDSTRAAKALNALLADFRTRPDWENTSAQVNQASGVDFVSDKPNARFAWPV